MAVCRRVCTSACGPAYCIGLDAMAYNAHRGPVRRDDLARTASQLSELLENRSLELTGSGLKTVT